MTTDLEDYKDIVTQIDFEMFGFLGKSKVVIKKNEKGAVVHMDDPFRGKPIEPGKPNPYEDKQIRPDKWRRIVSKLFDELRVQEWKKHYYTDEGIEDGVQWKLTIRLEGRKGIKIDGYSDYPRCWPEFKKIFRPYIEF